MLPSQRDLFDLPRHVCYLNAAGWSPRCPSSCRRPGAPAARAQGAALGTRAGFRGRAARAGAGGGGAADQRRSGRRRADPVRRLRRGDCGQGAGAASRRLAGCWCWRTTIPRRCWSGWTRARRRKASRSRRSRRPGDGDWTAALLEAIERPGAAPLAVGLGLLRSLVGWRRLGRWRAFPRALRARGAALVLGCDACGGRDDNGCPWRSTRTLLVFPAYKWLLGPLRARVPVRRQAASGGQRPLEQTSTRPARGARGAVDLSRRHRDMSPMRGASTWASAIISSRWRWRRSASRRWPPGVPPRSSQRLDHADGACLAGWAAAERRCGIRRDRACARPTFSASSFGRRRARRAWCWQLAAEKGPRGARGSGACAIGPHVYNDEGDVERFLAAFRRTFAQLTR